MSAFILWQEDYSVGITAIDSQHRQIIDVINCLYQLRRGEPTSLELNDAILRIQFFTESHFRYEETLLKYAGYPQLEEHRQLHLEMARRMASFLTDFEPGQQDDPEELFLLLREWWINHICGEDRQYIESVRRLRL